MDAVILAGGKGERMQAALNGLPKVLAPIGDRPFLHFVLDGVAEFASHIYVCLGHHSEEIFTEIRKWVDSRAYGSHPVTVTSYRAEPNGSLAALLDLRSVARFEYPIIVFNGDTNMNYKAARRALSSRKHCAAELVRVLSDSTGKAAGAFLFYASFFNRPHEEILAVSHNIDSALFSQIKSGVKFVKWDSLWFDIGTPIGLARFLKYYGRFLKR